MVDLGVAMPWSSWLTSGLAPLEFGLGFFQSLCWWRRSEIGRMGRLCLAAFWHPGCEWNTQMPFPASGLTCYCSDQWFRKLGFLFSVQMGKPEAVNMHCAVQSPEVQQAQKIHCACSYVRMLNTRVINLSSPQQLLGQVLMCFCVRFNCSVL